MIRNKSATLSFCIYLILQTIYANNENSDEVIKNNSSVIKRIADINMKTFDWRGEHWDCHTMVDYVRHVETYINQPPAPRKRSMTFTLFEKEEEHSGQASSIEIDNSSTWKDLDLFCGKSDVKKFVANSIDRTVTEIGKISLYSLLGQPKSNIEFLKKRQKIIAILREDKNLCASLEQSLQNIKNAENILLSLWESDHFRSTTNRISFPQFLDVMNKSEDLLLLKSALSKTDMSIGVIFKIITTAALVAYGILHLANVINTPQNLENWVNENHNSGVGASGGYLASFGWKINNRIVHSLISIFLGISCGSTLHWDIDGIYGNYLCEQLIQLMMINIAKAIENISIIYELFKKYPELGEFVEFIPLTNLFENKINASKDLSDLMQILKRNTFKGNPSILSHQGTVLRGYMLMQNLKENFESALTSVARVDAYLSIAKLMNENENKTNTWCFPEYKIDEKPFLKLTDFWHPLTNQNKVVTNSLTLGTDNNRPNIIITGPNEAGKSTALKAVTLCLLMAQTLGVAPASKMSFTPFSTISTYLNITDDIGVGNSLFKAEILRVQKLIDIAQNAQPGEFHFSIFDEIFNGTSPIEGSAAAYSVAKHLGSFENSICMIATHFNLLTRLEADSNSFTNYKVYVIKKDGGQIDYPYKIERGISDQNVVFDILKNEGFGSNIINEAQQLIS